MVALNAYFDGKVLIPDEPLALEPNQKVRIELEPIETPAPTEPTLTESAPTEPAPTEPKPKRVFGQQKDAVLYVAPDFDEHLGDDFWGLADEKRE